MAAARRVRQFGKRVLLAAVGYCLCFAAHGELRRDSTSYQLIVWHPFVGVQEQVFSGWIEEFAGREKVSVRLESGFDLSTALRKKAPELQFPDVVVAPSDLLRVSDSIPLVSLRAAEFFGRRFVTAGATRTAIHLFENGTIYLLRRRSAPSIVRRDQLFLQLGLGKRLVWTSAEPFFLIPFLLAEERSLIGVRRALQNFSELLTNSNTPFPCDHRCLMGAIEKRYADYALVGDWLLPDLSRGDYGKDYVLEPLPTYMGRCPSLPYVAFFPRQAQADVLRLALGKRLALWLSSPEMQRRIEQKFMKRSVAQMGSSLVGPEWMRAALGHRAQCFDASAFATPEFWAVASDVVRRLSAKNSSVSEIAIGLADVVTSSRREDLRHD